MKTTNIGDGSPIHLTAEGIEKLKDELARLKRALPARIEETARTAAYGDRSDNAEYKQAKGTLRRTHWRIMEIEDQLKRVVIIEPNGNREDSIQLGSTVVLEADGERLTFQILGPAETDPAKGRISDRSPLGTALMNHKKGDVVTVKTAHGSREYRILEVK